MKAGKYPIGLHAKNSKREATNNFKIIVGDRIALTPPFFQIDAEPLHWQVHKKAYTHFHAACRTKFMETRSTSIPHSHFIPRPMNRSFLYLTAVSMLVIVAVRGADSKPIRVLIWDEQQPAQKQAYGDKFLGETIAAHLGAQPGITVKTANLDSPEQGVDEATLDATDVVIWWAHIKSQVLTNANAERVAARVRDGKLGFIALHSAHWAKPFVRLMQDRAKADALAQVPEAERVTAQWKFLKEKPTMVKLDDPLTPSLAHAGGVWQLTLPQCVFPAWREDGAPSHVTTLLPEHPIAAGLPAHWDIPQTEMYNEPFHVPTPDAVIFEERWDKGEHFRSGCVWQVGKGRVFYFGPGHETFPVFQQAEPLRVIENTVRWLATEAK